MYSIPVLLTIREVAELLRIRRGKVYLLIETGGLQAVKIGYDWRVRRDSVEALIGEIPDEFFARTAAPQKCAA